VPYFLFDDARLPELFFKLGAKLFRRRLCQIVLENSDNYIVRPADLILQLPGGFVQPPAHPVSGDRRLADFAADNHRQAVRITPWVGHRFNREQGPAGRGTLPIDVP
jgi:hypothetical protein